MSLLVGKVESTQEIRSDAAQFFTLFTDKIHHMSDVSPHIENCAVHEGAPGAVGTIIHFDFMHDEKAKAAKDVIEAIDEENHLITLKVIEGDILDDYKSLRATIQATNKADGAGSLVRWTLDYEKLNADVPAPTKYLDIASSITEGFDQHIQEGLTA
uniref:Bet v I/Major latex protein domain-containing protein n=1 Tax=Kalanchoe fedtschenkoi TaxID=63787 RepID=A0A7N0UGZ8_KALFE